MMVMMVVVVVGARLWKNTLRHRPLLDWPNLWKVNGTYNNN
jgi:hypothetical protein